jgi:enoyl-CoA hydratase
MGNLVSYAVEGDIATVTMDDGKVNVLSFEMFAALNEALDHAESDGATVVLSGRPGAFSAGFDLGVLSSGGDAAAALARTGFELALRMLQFPAPVVVACSGHALAMGVFLVLSGDYRVGMHGPYRIGANEVAIGITMPHFGVEICRHRLSPSYFHRAVVNAEIFTPQSAFTAGFLDHVATSDEFNTTVHHSASGLRALDRRVHTATKLRSRAGAIAALDSAIKADAAEFGGVVP